MIDQQTVQGTSEAAGSKLTGNSIQEQIRALAKLLWQNFGQEANADLGYWLWAEGIILSRCSKEPSQRKVVVGRFARAHWELSGRLPGEDFGNWLKAVWAVYDIENRCKRTLKAGVF